MGKGADREQLGSSGGSACNLFPPSMGFPGFLFAHAHFGTGSVETSLCNTWEGHAFGWGLTI